MPLKMTIEPQEWLMIGTTRVVNIHLEQAQISIDGAAPVLRQAHTLDSATADTPSRRVYLAVQRLYLGFAQDAAEYHKAAEDLLEALPTTKDVVVKANTQMAKGSVYGALREYRKLLDLQSP